MAAGRAALRPGPSMSAAMTALALVTLYTCSATVPPSLPPPPLPLRLPLGALRAVLDGAAPRVLSLTHRHAAAWGS
jgi:hypothetical protein